MIILAYLGILALVPLLVEKEDQEVQWHAKNGLVFTVTWIILFIALGIVGLIPYLGFVLSCGLYPILSIGIMVIHIIAIMKGLRGERFRLPVVSDYTDRWK